MTGDSYGALKSKQLVRSRRTLYVCPKDQDYGQKNGAGAFCLKCELKAITKQKNGTIIIMTYDEIFKPDKISFVNDNIEKQLNSQAHYGAKNLEASETLISYKHELDELGYF
jgi:hypothetical protein